MDSRLHTASAHSVLAGFPMRGVGTAIGGTVLCCLLALWGVCGTALAADSKKLVVLAFGDSLTAGYGLPPGAGFAPRLERALNDQGCNVRVIDGGVSGDTSADGLARAQWALNDPPDVVIVELGANDALRGLPVAQLQQNLTEIVATFKESGAAVLLAGMKAPPNLGDNYAAAFNRVFPAVAKEQQVALYPFFIAPVAANPALLLSDGLHPTAEGVDRMVEAIIPSLKRLLLAKRST